MNALQNHEVSNDAKTDKPNNLFIFNSFILISLKWVITSLAILKLVREGAFQDPTTKEKITDPAKIKILDFLPKSFQPEGEVRESWADITLKVGICAFITGY